MTTPELLYNLYTEGVQSVDPEHLVRMHLQRDDKGITIAGKRLDKRYKKLLLCAAGKAALPMAKTAAGILGEWMDGGVVITPKKGKIPGLDVMESDHPIPTKRSVKATDAMIKAITAMPKDHYLLFLLSGGASALMEKPASGLSLQDMNATGALLLQHALPIESVNCIRKHLSSVKGGRLGAMVPTEGSVLVLSDVIGDNLGTIASGPLYADRTTFEDALTIIKEAGLERRLPDAVFAHLKAGAAGEKDETPKTPRESLPHHIIGSNRIALEAIRIAAQKHIPDVRIITDRLSGEASEQARSIVQTAKIIAAEPHDEVLLIYGGEPTVTVNGNGKGGRNQELALAAAISLENTPGITLLSAGTDGIDGNSDAAGAIVDHTTVARAKAAGLHPDSYLENNDSYHFHQQTQSLIRIGYTGTNVMDIILVHIKRS